MNTTAESNRDDTSDGLQILRGRLTRSNDNRIVAGLAAGIAAALIVGFAVAVIGFVRVSQERDRANWNLQLARRLVSDVIAPASDRLELRSRTQEIRGDILEQALNFYEQSLGQTGDDPAALHEMAQILRRLGSHSFIVYVYRNNGYNRFPRASL